MTLAIRRSDFTTTLPPFLPFERNMNDQTKEQAPHSLIVQALEYPFQVLKPFPITIEPVDNGFVAGFVDADVYASGETYTEAISNLKSLLVDLYKELLKQRNVLDREPKRQLEVIQSFVTANPDAR